MWKVHDLCDLEKIQRRKRTITDTSMIIHSTLYIIISIFMVVIIIIRFHNNYFTHFTTKSLKVTV